MKGLIVFLILLSSTKILGQNFEKLIKDLTEECYELEEDSFYLAPDQYIAINNLIDSLKYSNNSYYFNRLYHNCHIMYGWENFNYKKRVAPQWLKLIQSTKIPMNEYCVQGYNITSHEEYLKIIHNRKHPFRKFNFRKALIEFNRPFLLNHIDSFNYPSNPVSSYIEDSWDFSILDSMGYNFISENVRLSLADLAFHHKNYEWAIKLSSHDKSKKFLEMRIDAAFGLGIEDSILPDILSFLKLKYDESTHRITPKSINQNLIKIYKLHKEFIYYGEPPFYGPTELLEYAKICFDEENWTDCQTSIIKALRYARNMNLGGGDEKPILKFGQSLYSLNINLTNEFKMMFPAK